MKQKILTGILVGAFSNLFLSACVSTSFRPALNAETPKLLPASPAAIRVFDSTPSEAFLTLGEIEAYISGYPTDETIIRKAREQAAAVGADAIILNPDVLTMKPGGNSRGLRPKLASVRFTAIRLIPKG